MLNAKSTPTTPAIPSAQDLFAAIDVAKRFAASFEPGLYTREDAKKLVYATTELKRVATTITRNAKTGAKPSRIGSTDGRPGSTNRRGSAKRATGLPAQDKLL